MNSNYGSLPGEFGTDTASVISIPSDQQSLAVETGGITGDTTVMCHSIGGTAPQTAFLIPLLSELEGRFCRLVQYWQAD
jgi:hypothetical protein